MRPKTRYIIVIETQSRRRAAATGGVPRIPVDDVTAGTVRDAGWELAEVLPEGLRLAGAPHRQLASGRHHPRRHRRANPELCRVAVTAAEAMVDGFWQFRKQAGAGTTRPNPSLACCFSLFHKPKLICLQISFHLLSYRPCPIPEHGIVLADSQPYLVRKLCAC